MSTPTVGDVVVYFGRPMRVVDTEKVAGHDIAVIEEHEERRARDRARRAMRSWGYTRPANVPPHAYERVAQQALAAVMVARVRVDLLTRNGTGAWTRHTQEE